MHAVTPLTAGDISAAGPLDGLGELGSPIIEPLPEATRLRAAWASYAEQPESADAWTELRQAQQAASAAIARLPRAETQTAAVEEARALVREMSASGAHDRRVSAGVLAEADQLSRKHWPGLLAAMLLVPAWQWPKAPMLLDVPDWLRVDYVTWLFAAPQGFCEIGDADAFALQTLNRLEELARWVKRSPGARAEAEVLAAYSQVSAIPLYFSQGSLRRQAELRGQLLARAFQQPGQGLARAARPRAGRRLRIGFVNRHFGSQTETYTTLPTFEQLDPQRFEVTLFTHHANGSKLEEYARRHATRLQVLPPTLEAQIEALRAAELDVVVFGTNVTAVCNEVTKLALHRVAPLQVVNNSSCITSGLPEIDLYVSGALTESEQAASHFTERLGLLPGPAHAFNYEADRAEPTGGWTREMLGLPGDAVVFVTAANYFKIIPEMQHAWARLLAAVPGSRLLVHPFNPNWSSSYPIKRFAAEFDRVLTAHGVETDRWVLSTVKFPSRNDVKELLRVGDVYLDTFPFGGVNSLVDPLELGLPVVAWEGETFRSRMGAALLRQLGLDEFVARTEADYLACAKALANDANRRTELATQIAESMSRTPLFLDSLAASDAFGGLIERAYDELVERGHAAFRGSRSPLSVPAIDDAMALIDSGVASFEQGDVAAAGEQARRVLAAVPAHPAARHLMGAVLLSNGEAVRAVEYFLGAVQQTDGNAPLWHDLAIALHESGRPAQAVQALETSLRLDQNRLEGWLLLAELAVAANNQEMFSEALEVARGLAPNDERVEALARSGGNSGQATIAAESPHVLLYTDDPQHGGVAQYNHAVLLALVRAGYRVTCVQTESASPLVQQQRAAGVQHVWIGYDTGREFARTVNDTATPRRILAAARPDFVLFSDCCPMSNLGARDAALELGLPFAVVVGFVGDYLARNFATQLPRLAKHYRTASDVVAVSQENLQLLRAHFGLSEDRGRVIHYGRPEKFFAPRDEAARARLRAEMNLPADAVLCLTTARLAAVKGFDHQFRAFAALRGTPAFDQLYFAWVGEGEERPKLEKQIAQLGLGDRVHLLGHRWDVADWYDAADIFVLPSHMEGMPLAIMEAMAKGLPVIATAVSGIPEELGETGKLLPSPAVESARAERELAETLKLWASNPHLRQQIGAGCHARANQMFREARMVEQTLGLCPVLHPVGAEGGNP